MRRRILALSLLLSLFLTGCSGNRSGHFAILPYAREIENMALMRTMGVDTGKMGTDTIAVTVSSGVQSKGANKGSQPPIVLTQESGTISGACLAMQAEGASYIFYGHVGQLLLGQTLAAQGVEGTLEFVLQDIEMRLDTQLYIVRGATAAEAIAATSEGETSVADRLEAMQDDAGLGSRSATRSVKEVLGDLETNGCTFVPAVAVTPTGDDSKSITATGYAILREYGLAGWAEGETALGVNLLLGEMDADVLELNLPETGQIALRVVAATTRVEPVFAGTVLTGVNIHCKVDANLAEAPSGLVLQNNGVLALLDSALAETQKTRIEAALGLAQSLNADFLNLEKRAGLAAPWHWQEIQRQWNLPALEFAVTVEADVRRSYDVDHQ